MGGPSRWPLCTAPQQSVELPPPDTVHRTHGVTQLHVKAYSKAAGTSVKLGPLTYKVALLKPAEKRPAAPSGKRTLPPRATKKRCFRCLASDHFVRNCRDPVRCAACFRTGHRARHYHSRFVPPKPSMQRARSFRPHVSKVFIPMTEDVRNRQSQRRSAVLSDIIGRSNLGHFPQERIAVDLAERFGGFSTDFLVARYQERDYVILLLEWVRPEDLISNGLTRLSHCRLRCFS